MGWAYGELDGREVGYAVTATCDAEGCTERIDRGVDYRCGFYVDGLDGCGRYFCYEHLRGGGECKHEDIWSDEPDPGIILERDVEW